MASFTATLLSPPRQDDPLAAIRQKNKRLIIVFFLLILVVAAVTCGIIVSLVHDLNQKNSVTGIQEFCAFVHTESSCVNFLSRTIQARPKSTPIEILRLSLQAALDEVSKLRPLIRPSDSDSLPNPRFRSTVLKCAVWIRESEAELGNATRLMWRDPDEATRAALWVVVDAARRGLGGCRQAVEMFLLEASEAETGKLYPPLAAVEQVSKLLYYGVVFMENMDAVNENYYAWIGQDLKGALDDLGVVTLYGVLYAVLVFLFCLLLRIA